MSLHKQSLSDDRYISMKAKFDSYCAECEQDIREGDQMLFDTKYKKAYCEECGKEYQ